MTKFRLITDKTEETKWLNQMAAEGHAFINYFAGFYTFEDCTPGQYVFRSDHSDAFFSTTQDYKEFQKKAGTDLLQCWGTRVYLRKETSQAPIADYPNTAALLEHYIKLRDTFKLASMLEIICYVLELYAAISGFVGGFLLTLGIGIILLVCMQLAIEANKVVLELREKKKERPKEYETQMGKISIALVLGIICSSAPFAIQGLGGSQLIASILQLLSFFFLAVGIVKTRHIWGK